MEIARQSKAPRKRFIERFVYTDYCLSAVRGDLFTYADSLGRSGPYLASYLYYEPAMLGSKSKAYLVRSNSYRIASRSRRVLRQEDGLRIYVRSSNMMIFRVSVYTTPAAQVAEFKEIW